MRPDAASEGRRNAAVIQIKLRVLNKRLCVVDGCSTTGRCYQFCKADKDCSSAPCSKDVGGGQKVCDVPTVACNPVGATPQQGCAATFSTISRETAITA